MAHLIHALFSITLSADEISLSLSLQPIAGFSFHCWTFWTSASKSGAEENRFADIAADETAL